MYQVYCADYCGAAHAVENDCNCDDKPLYCCHSSSRCHIVLGLNLAGHQYGNMFSFSYLISENSYVMPGGKIPEECAVDTNAFDIYINGQTPEFIKVGTVEEMIPLLNLPRRSVFSIKEHDPLEIKAIVKNILDDYRDAHIISIIKRRQEAENTDIASKCLSDRARKDKFNRELTVQQEATRSYHWVLNPEYTEEELAIEHPFFGNVSEMVSVRIAAIAELQSLVNDCNDPPFAPLLK